MKKIEVNLDELRKKHLYIATPAYSGGTHSAFVSSLLSLQQMLSSYGIPHTVQFMFNESLISRARNKLAEMFLATDATHMLFIDADIEFDPKDVILLMYFDKDLIGGAYPLKRTNWENIKRAVLKNPDISAEDLSKQGAMWATHPFQGRMALEDFEPVKIQELATGFMMIKREVFEKLKPTVPTFAPAPNDPSQPAEGVSYDFFFVGVHDNRYESEDYSFCRKWSELGGDIWLCPWIRLTHYGSYGFKGDLISLANNLGEVH